MTQPAQPAEKPTVDLSQVKIYQELYEQQRLANAATAAQFAAFQETFAKHAADTKQGFSDLASTALENHQDVERRLTVLEAFKQEMTGRADLNSIRAEELKKELGEEKNAREALAKEAQDLKDKLGAVDAKVDQNAKDMQKQTELLNTISGKLGSLVDVLNRPMVRRVGYAIGAAILGALSALGAQHAVSRK